MLVQVADDLSQIRRSLQHLHMCAPVIKVPAAAVVVTAGAAVFASGTLHHVPVQKGQR